MKSALAQTCLGEIVRQYIISKYFAARDKSYEKKKDFRAKR